MTRHVQDDYKCRLKLDLYTTDRNERITNEIFILEIYILDYERRKMILPKINN